MRLISSSAAATGIIIIFHCIRSHLPLSQRQELAAFFQADCSVWEQDTAAGLEYSVYRFIHGDRQAQWWCIEGAWKQIMPNEGSFSKTHSVQLWSKKSNHHIEVMVTVNINT